MTEAELAQFVKFGHVFTFLCVCDLLQSILKSERLERPKNADNFQDIRRASKLATERSPLTYYF